MRDINIILIYYNQVWMNKITHTYQNRMLVLLWASGKVLINMECMNLQVPTPTTHKKIISPHLGNREKLAMIIKI